MRSVRTARYGDRYGEGVAIAVCADAGIGDVVRQLLKERVMTHRSGRHFLQIPGPTNVPDRGLRAIDHATIDHRSQDFGALGRAVLAGLKPVFGTSGPVIVLPSSGTGAWEAALVNTLSPGDAVLMFETGHFATIRA